MLSTPGDPWSSERARRWLERTGAGVKRGGRWITTPELLADNFPEVYRALMLAQDDDLLEVDS